MSKKINFILLIISILFLNSCAFLGGRLYDDTGKKADARLKEIIEIINNRDKEALKNIFSEKALDEAIDLDEQIDYLFDFINGEIISWESIVRGAGTNSINRGERVKTSSSRYYINTNSQKYFIYFREYLINTKEPKSVGVYLLQIIEAENKEERYNGDPKNEWFGIYKPEE